MFIVLAYIKFLLRSTNQHGVHSPFVYGLVTKCFYDKKKYQAYDILRDFRRSLLQDKRMISVTDFGAGSRVFRSEKRKISEIAKKAGISPGRARLLNRLVRYLKVEEALELGTSVGLGTTAMAAGNNVRVTSIEGCPETAKIASEKFRKFAMDNIDLKVGRFEEVLGSGVKENPKAQNSYSKLPELINFKYDLIYLDGNHQKEATLNYFTKLVSVVHNDSVVILDDIHWSKEMEEAWDAIKLHPRVKVTIDTFQWGFVFFRREQEKEHFVIRV